VCALETSTRMPMLFPLPIRVFLAARADVP
jgi:hypothetical protein